MIAISSSGMRVPLATCSRFAPAAVAAADTGRLATEIAGNAPLAQRGNNSLLMLALPSVNKCMLSLPDSRKKTSIKLAVEAYADAGRAWAVMSKGPQSASKQFPAMAKLLKDRYDAPPEILHAFVRGEHLPVLNYLWVKSYVYLAFAT